MSRVRFAFKLRSSLCAHTKDANLTHITPTQGYKFIYKYIPKSATCPPLTGVFSLSFFEFAVHGIKEKKMYKVKYRRGEKLKYLRKIIQRLSNSAMGMKTITSFLVCKRGDYNRLSACLCAGGRQGDFFGTKVGHNEWDLV